MSWVYRPPSDWGRRVRRLAGPPLLLVASGLTAPLCQVDVSTPTAAIAVQANTMVAPLSQVDVATIAPQITGQAVTPISPPLRNQWAARWALYNPDWSPQIVAGTVRFLPLIDTGTIVFYPGASSVNVTTLAPTVGVAGTGTVAAPLQVVNVATLAMTGGGSGVFPVAAPGSAVGVATLAPSLTAIGTIALLPGALDVNISTPAAAIFLGGTPQQTLAAPPSLVAVATLAAVLDPDVASVGTAPLALVDVATAPASLAGSGLAPALVASLAGVTVATPTAVAISALALLPVRVEFHVRSLYSVRWRMPRNAIDGQNDLLFKVKVFNEATGQEITSGLPLVGLIAATKGGPAIGALTVPLTYDGTAKAWTGVIDRAVVESELAGQTDGVTLFARIDDGLNVRRSRALPYDAEPSV